MNPQMFPAYTKHQRRSRAVYGTLRQRRSPAGVLAAEFMLLAAVALGVAGVIALRAWLAVAA